MNRLPLTAMGVLMLAVLSTPAWAKGTITKIVIEGQSLQSPIEIVDPEILDKFTIWSGPGVGGWDMINTIPKADDPRFIVDWTQGIVSDHPSGSRRYFVSIHIEGRKPPRNTYEVMYVIDSVDDMGYVYLPSHPKDDFGQWNTFQIYRGVEGNWFRPTKDWEEVVRPLVGKE